MRLSATVVALILSHGALVLAQGRVATGVVRGEVTDSSGAVLPGATIVASSVTGRVLATVVTDEVGRYELRALPIGPVKIQFQLEAFDTATVQLNVQPDSESIVDERLTLAQITESVVVYAKAPPEPPRSLPAIPYRPAPPPVVIPVPREELESVCKPAKAEPVIDVIGTIHSHRHEAGRTIFTKGDELNIDAGLAKGLTVGRNLVVRRHYRPDRGNHLGSTGEHTAGLLQIVAATEQSSTAVVVHACNEVLQGDFLAAFDPRPVRASDPNGIPAFGDAIRILFADSGQLFGAPGRLLVIDRGASEGIARGQRLTLFRESPAAAKPFVLGEAVVIDVKTDSATIRVEGATDAIFFGDWAAPQRPMPPALAPVARMVPPRD
jgi:hypothetical protein